MVSAFEAEGLSNQEARERLWFVDKDGLLVKSRSNELMPHNLPYAHDMDQMSFLEAIDTIRPNILIGATGAPGTFTEEVVRAMTRINNRPAIFALSNPTSRAECTAEQAYDWSNGLAIFSSGSPFDPVKFEGKTYKPGQGNNAYIFPGVGLGAIVAEAETITDHMFMTAAKTLASLVSENDLEHGALYPSLHTIRDVSLEIAVAVAEEAYETGNAQAVRPDDLRGTIVAQMYDPHY
jgi:malate dehydrogenase (oxaloacetate-decarboxylating)(NADP+)